MQRGIVEAWKGNADEALRLFTEGRDRYIGIGGHSAVPAFGASLALNLAACGRIDDARRVQAEAWAELHDRREHWNEPVLLIADATLAQGADAIADRARAVAAAFDLSDGDDEAGAG
jgi:hypothetical protein